MGSSNYQRTEVVERCQICGSTAMTLPRRRRAHKVCGIACLKERDRLRRAVRCKREPRSKAQRDRVAARAKLSRQAAIAARVRLCGGCGSEMRGQHHMQKYCSDECRRECKNRQQRARPRRQWTPELAEYFREYRRKHPEHNREYQRRYRLRLKHTPKFKAKRKADKRRWEAKNRAIVAAVLDTGLFERPVLPSSRNAERKKLNAAIVAAARELGFA